ncbi:tachykinin-4 isoform X2 [Saccopteryx leptura]|uniref:tachykinin-4 isoform X2 n=1 Tax=Saccopteryx leptura TaxID=249018 RepID=UPI00339C9469
MLFCFTPLLLMGLSACTVAGDKKLALGSAEAGSWVTLTLEDTVVPSIQLQFQEAKRGQTRQFFGLMGKKVGGIPPIQPERKMGHRRGQMAQDLLGRTGPSTEGGEDEDHGLAMNSAGFLPGRAVSSSGRWCINVQCHNPNLSNCVPPQHSELLFHGMAD